MAATFEEPPKLVAGLFTPALKRSHKQSLLVPTTWAGRAVLLVVAVLLVAAPGFADPYHLAIAIAIALGVIGAVATNLVTGVAGQASIGNAAFMAIGAFTAAQFGIYAHWPSLAAILMGGVASGLVGMLVGIPAIRVRGLYFVIGTLALHYLTIFVLTGFQSSRVGDLGFIMPRVKIGTLTQTETWYFIIVLSAIASVVIMRNIVRTRFGRAWAAIARDELGATVLGVNVRRQKIAVFGLTSLMIGIQGGMFAYYIGVVSIDPFNFDLAVSYVAMIVIGGIASPAGTVLGAFFVVGLPYAVTYVAAYLPTSLAQQMSSRLFDFEAVIYGLAIVIFMVWERRGLIVLWYRLAAALRTWPLARRVGPSPDV